MKVYEYEEGNPANAGNDNDVFDMIRKGRATGCVELHSVGWRLSTRKAVKVKVALIIIGCAQVLTFLQGLLQFEK